MKVQKYDYTWWRKKINFEHLAKMFFYWKTKKTFIQIGVVSWKQHKFKIAKTENDKFMN